MWFGGDALMALAMSALVVGWLRAAEVSTRDEPGWLEQARRAAFDSHVGAAESTEAATTTIDEDEAARGAYNDWLARLNRSG
jgi:hypothetical protein